jgi:hypothetical protein
LMEYLFDIVGLRYYALQADKWKSLFNADGTLRAAYVGQSLTLRHSPSDLTTYTIEALSDGQLWGNLCDFEKLVARSLLEGVESQALRAVITGGYAEVHSLKVSVRSDVMPQIVERNDLSAYEQWYASAKGYPSLELTQEEQQLDRLVFSLEEQLSRGSWNHQLLEDVLAIGAIDLSEEMNTRRLKLLTRMDNSGDAEIQLDRQRLFTATVHKGSREERRRWASHLLDDVSGTREMDLLRLQLRQASSDELEALLISFPRNVFALWQIDPVLAIATLDYAHLPRRILRLFLSLFMAWTDRRTSLPAAAETMGQTLPVNAFTAQQLAILFYYQMHVEQTWDSVSKRQIASTIEAISGISSGNVYKRLNFQAHFNDPAMRRDLLYVANTVRDIFPTVSHRILNELKS